MLLYYEKTQRHWFACTSAFGLFSIRTRFGRFFKTIMHAWVKRLLCSAVKEKTEKIIEKIRNDNTIFYGSIVDNAGETTIPLVKNDHFFVTLYTRRIFVGYGIHSIRVDNI